MGLPRVRCGPVNGMPNVVCRTTLASSEEPLRCRPYRSGMGTRFLTFAGKGRPRLTLEIKARAIIKRIVAQRIVASPHQKLIVADGNVRVCARRELKIRCGQFAPSRPGARAPRAASAFCTRLKSYLRRIATGFYSNVRYAGARCRVRLAGCVDQILTMLGRLETKHRSAR